MAANSVMLLASTEAVRVKNNIFHDICTVFRVWRGPATVSRAQIAVVLMVMGGVLFMSVVISNICLSVVGSQITRARMAEKPIIRARALARIAATSCLKARFVNRFPSTVMGMATVMMATSMMVGWWISLPNPRESVERSSDRAALVLCAIMPKVRLMNRVRVVKISRRASVGLCRRLGISSPTMVGCFWVSWSFCDIFKNLKGFGHIRLYSHAIKYNSFYKVNVSIMFGAKFFKECCL